jgi:hypothetical protein
MYKVKMKNKKNYFPQIPLITADWDLVFKSAKICENLRETYHQDKYLIRKYLTFVIVI